jgi:2-amino-4-hydroxy-6-hydroxymethyldihydropteridine diphosphokinase
VEHLVYLGLGTNLGDRKRNLRDGIRLLSPQVAVEAVSDLYETEPVGMLDQPKFLNAACEGRTQLDPEPLLDHVKNVERLVGRVPGPRWGPRALDIDLLLYDAAIINLPNLRVPHERLAERAFVLRPLADLNPTLRVPGLGTTISELLQKVDIAGVWHLSASDWNRSDVELL